MATKKKPTNSQNTAKKKQATETLKAINNVDVNKDVENVIKTPETEPENVKKENAEIISEANEILENVPNIEKEIEENKEELEKIVETEIKKVEKVIEKGKKVLRKNNSEAFTDFWNGATIY